MPCDMNATLMRCRATRNIFFSLNSDNRKFCTQRKLVRCETARSIEVKKTINFLAQIKKIIVSEIPVGFKINK